MAERLFGNFVHDNLANPSQQIRLLQLSREQNTVTDGFNLIRCELSTWKIADAPEYAAISYTWGDPNQIRAIAVNGKPHDVRQNCWYVLWQMRFHGFSGYLWIDAICINQKNNAEKAHQVALMGKIYRDALQVNICIGPDLEVSGSAQSEEQPVKQLFARLNQYSDSVTERLAFAREFNESLIQESTVKPNKDTKKWLQAENGQDLIQIFYDLAKRNYFHRVWIVQELCLAKRRFIFCGTWKANFDHFCAIHKALLGAGGAELDDRRCSRSSSNQSTALATLIEQLALPSTQDCIVNMVKRFSSDGFQCWDARDKVYGLLSMVDWQDLQPILPDYTKSTYDLLIEVISHLPSTIIRSLDGTSILRNFDSKSCGSHSPMKDTIVLLEQFGLRPWEHPIATMLQSRQQNPNPGDHPYLPRRQIWQDRRRIEVLPDQVFRLHKARGEGSTNLTACLFSLPQTRREERAESRVRYPWSQRRSVERNSVAAVVPHRVITNGRRINDPLAKVPQDAREDDILVRFAAEVPSCGLVLRRTESNDASCRLEIVGQAIMDGRAEPCRGARTESPCQCGLSSSQHKGLEKKLLLYFDPEDLLLFVAQSVEEYHEDGYQKVSRTLNRQMERLRTPVVGTDDQFSSYGELQPPESDSRVLNKMQTWADESRVEESRKRPAGRSVIAERAVRKHRVVNNL